LFWAKHLFNEVADIAQYDLVNSRTFKDLWNEIQGLSSTCLVFKYFQGLEFRIKNSSSFKDAWEPCSALNTVSRKQFSVTRFPRPQTLPRLFINFPTYPWQLSSSWTFPGFPDKWSHFPQCWKYCLTTHGQAPQHYV